MKRITGIGTLVAVATAAVLALPPASAYVPFKPDPHGGMDVLIPPHDLVYGGKFLQYCNPGGEAYVARHIRKRSDGTFRDAEDPTQAGASWNARVEVVERRNGFRAIKNPHPFWVHVVAGCLSSMQPT